LANNEQVSDVARIGVEMISMQLELSSTSAEHALGHLWALGYCFGVFDALGQRAKFDQYTDGLLLMTIGFQYLVSDIMGGADKLGLAIDSQGDNEFADGSKLGGSEIYAWLADSKNIPLGLQSWLRARRRV
jgi:hypothetical protein